MRAVNLVPKELRSAGGPSRSGGAVYGLLGVLALAVVLVSVNALLGGRVADREAQVAALEAEAVQAEAQAATFTRYKALAAETSGRVQRVRDLAAGRIDWSGPLSEVSRAVGTEVRFTALQTSTSPTANAGGAANPLRAALPLPAVEVEGCARDHAAVARLIARFRAMRDVKRVSLATSDRKPQQDPAAATATQGERKPTCRGFAKHPADFQVVVFLTAKAAATATAAPGAAATTATTTATPSGTTK